ncbi:uncharacterized protein C2orf81 homolog [Cheilinus undulatus]|uniref:uncharacterized protein C2orf81 homolog n=1 Tax=Cheilinus undulatus TaxID=241271 RepID=UPI001BD4EC28|nr:uncharacterized protein C2orf81 homolog [Cheilinus undulatus]XP_041642372.1 uncharacterized protein C2orf81 homolog [Cheilinus undulatus]
MPRSAVKSQADKRQRRPSVQMTTPSVENMEDEAVISGCLTKAQWISQLIQEDADETVGEIMEDLLSRVMEGCFKVYIKNQMAPFSTSWAKSYHKQTVEQKIMCLDERDIPEEVAETEDSEPLPTIFDSWAQGCVLVIQGPTQQLHPTQQQVADIKHIPPQVDPSPNQQCSAKAQKRSSPKQSQDQKSPRRPLTDECCKVFTPHPPPKLIRKKIQPVNLPPKPVQSKLLPPLSCSAERRDGEVGSKNTRHSISSHMTGSFYQQKISKPIPKLDPSCLPQHCIFPQYEIVDEDCTKPVSKKPSGLSKLEPRKTSLKNLTKSTNKQEGMVSSGPLRLDTMGLAKGVSLLDSQTVDMNSLKLNLPALSTNLKPIRRDVVVPMFSVDQVTTGLSPQVTHCFSSTTVTTDDKM